MVKKYTLAAFVFCAVFLFALFGLVGITKAAVTGTSTALTSNPVNTLKANATEPVLRLDLSATGGETLSSIGVNINSVTSATPTALAASGFSGLMLMKDSNMNGILDGNDIFIASSTVNLGSTSTITIATTTSATGTFFVVLNTASSSLWTDNGYPEIATSTPQKFTVSIASNGIVTSTNSPTINAITTQAFTADTHSQIPNISKITNNFQNPNYFILDSGSGGVDEMGTMYVYDLSTSTSPIATGTVSQTGQMNINLGSQQRNSVWLEETDVAGNATSSRVQYNFSGIPSVTSVTAFTDRIIINLNTGLNGQQASNCSNYTLNGSALNCVGPGYPFIEFFGNQIVIHGLNLVQGSTATLSISGINTVNNTPFSYANNNLTVQQASFPTITSLSSNSGSVGSSVSITGTNFGSATGTVLFSGGFSPATGPMPGVQASTTAWSNTSITAVVPAGAQGGPLQVVASGGAMSDMNPNTFFDVPANLYVKLALVATSSPITTSTNMKLAIGSMNGMSIRYVGDGSTTFSTSTYVYTIPNVSSQGFLWAYDASGANLPAPGAPVQPNTSSSSPQILVLASSTSYNISGTITLGSSCPAGYQNQYVAVMAMPQAASSPQMNSVQPAFFKTSGSCQASYALALPETGVYNIQAHLPPQTSVTGLLDPAGQNVSVSTSTPTATANFTLTSATRSIYGQIVDGSGNPLSADKYNNLMVFAYQPIQGGQGAVAQPNSGGYFRVYATTGAYKLNVGGQGMPNVIESDILVSTSTAFDVSAATPVITFKLVPPSSYIDGYVKDAMGNAIPGVDIYSYCDGGSGGGHSATDGQGYYKMFVTPCSNYHVGGFSSSYGKIAEQSGVNIADSSASATVNFTINNANFITISGTVSQNGVLVSGANVWITQGEFGPSVGGGQTNGSGSYSLMVASGSSNLYVHVAVMGSGQLGEQQINGGAVVNGNVSGVNIASNMATLTIQLSPGNTFSQAFLMAQSSVGSGYANTPASTSSSYDTYQIQVPYVGSTSYTISGGIPGFGPIPATTTVVTGNATIPINLGSINFYTISGNVSGDYSNAFVWAGGSNGGGGTQVNPDGTFSLQLKQGIYDIGVNKPGYIGSLLAQQNISTTTSGLNLALTQSTSTITGTVQYNGSAISGVRVWADNSSGGWAGAQTDANGYFSLSVTPGDWIVHAIADGYQLASPLLITAPVSGITVNLQAVSFQPKQQLQSINPTQGGTVQTSNTQVQIPQGALGSGSNNVQLSITDTMSTPNKKGAKVIGTGENISASYASGSNQGQQITTLSQNVTLQFVLTKAQLISSGISSIVQAQNMKIGYDDPTSNAWTNLPTNVALNPTDATWDTLVSITLSGPTGHFSTYAPILPTSGNAPVTPTGLQASAGNGQIALTWNSVSGAANYNVYRQSGSNYAYLAQVSSTSYTNTGLSNGTAYSYEVTALDSSGNESAATAAVSATPVAPTQSGGGGFNAAAYYASLASTGTTSTTTATTTTATTTNNTPVVATSTPVGLSGKTVSNLVSLVVNNVIKITGTLKQGARNKEVTSLQEFLANYPDIYPEGIVSGYYGPATTNAIRRFQEKYGIAKKGNGGYGIVGPMTRAKINELLSETSVSPSIGGNKTSQNASVQAQNVMEIKAQIQVLQQKLVQLLMQLMQELQGKVQ